MQQAVWVWIVQASLGTEAKWQRAAAKMICCRLKSVWLTEWMLIQGLLAQGCMEGLLGEPIKRCGVEMRKVAG